MTEYCTRAVTGSNHPAHQPIYICDTCQLYDDREEEGSDGEREPLPSCICQSCAETCHDGHEVYYVGVGPCTCDCPNMVTTVGATTHKQHKKCCQLAEQSKEEAQRMGFTELRLLNVPIPLKVPPMLSLSEVDVDSDPGEENVEGDENNDNDTDNASKKEEEEELISQSMSNTNMCIECHSSMGGYIYASHTLPALADDRGDNNRLCQNLIRQAEALTKQSHETFWVPDDDNDATATTEGNNNGWCDLEILAREIYQRHVQTYSLQITTSTSNNVVVDDDDDDATTTTPQEVASTKATTTTTGGAEWWVQVKPAGTSRAPVDLHYDKDEALAETFGLGSFPTLSTVTYLTGEDDNQPTVVFPHTYNDEEDGAIESMLLSRAARAKHLVFDGRLLHGAPAHPALLGRCTGNQQHNDESDAAAAADDDTDRGSSLRVTFLVNIWKSGRPAGVNVLPESIRAKIKSAATEEESSFERSMMPLEFRQRHVSKLTVPATKMVGTDGRDATSAPEEERIVLPFVSQGATWIGGDEEEEEEGETAESSEGESLSGNDDGDNGSKGEPELDDGEDDDDEEEEDDDELVMVISPFATPEYMEDKADTIIIDWEGSGARLVRGGALNDTNNMPGCRWKKLIAGNTAAKFLSDLTEQVPLFVTSIVAELGRQCGVDASNLQADHVCYRTDSMEQYTSLVDALQSAGTGDFTLLVESEIGGRPIATFKLATPIEVQSADSSHSIDVIEIPSPKEGSPYKAGLEHVEFVIGDNTHNSPLNGEAHHTALNAWIERYPSVSWDTKALDKQCNPDVSTKLELDDYGKVSIKFHLMPLEDVIEFETGGM